MHRKAYVVVGTVEYETSSVLRAFREEGKAQTFVDKLYAHTKKQPQASTYPDPEIYDSKMKRWRKRCPGGPQNTGFDHYGVTVTPFI